MAGQGYAHTHTYISSPVLHHIVPYPVDKSRPIKRAQTFLLSARISIHDTHSPHVRSYPSTIIILPPKVWSAAPLSPLLTSCSPPYGSRVVGLYCIIDDYASANGTIRCRLFLKKNMTSNVKPGTTAAI